VQDKFDKKFEMKIEKNNFVFGLMQARGLLLTRRRLESTPNGGLNDIAGFYLSKILFKYNVETYPYYRPVRQNRPVK
jgi:hypothetical protein